MQPETEVKTTMPAWITAAAQRLVNCLPDLLEEASTGPCGEKNVGEARRTGNLTDAICHVLWIEWNRANGGAK